VHKAGTAQLTFLQCTTCTNACFIQGPLRSVHPLESIEWMDEVLTGCCVQVRRQGATALIGVEARPVPDLASLTQLAQYTEQVLKIHGSGFMQADSLLKAAKHAEKTLSSAATNSFMYV